MKSYKCIVPVSGGKDSQACLKMAVEEFGCENVLGLFCDTKFEHPITYAHVNKLKEYYGADIHTLNGGDVASECIKNARFPSGTARFCTDKLKIRETKYFLKEYSEKFGGVQVWYGMRTDESQERAKRYQYRDPDDLYEPHVLLGNYPKYLGRNGVRYRVPIVDWTREEVIEYLEGKENELYRMGFDRVGCFPCLAAGDAWKIKAFTHDDFGKEQLIKVRGIETKIVENNNIEIERLSIEHKKKRKSIIIEFAKRYIEKEEQLIAIDHYYNSKTSKIKDKSIFTSNIGKAFNAGCMINKNQVDMFELGDSSHGCRICEI